MTPSNQRKQLVRKGFLYCAVVLALAMCGIAPAIAQFPPPPPVPTPPAEAQPVPAPSKGKKAPGPANSSIVGNWSGQLTQIGSQTPYKFELVIGPRGAETTYPDLDCTGKLTRVGASKSYAFFVEIITKGAVDKGGRCPDGTITVTRAGNDLALFWFGSIEANTIVAYGTLSKK
jgi:hypothetical protein